MTLKGRHWAGIWLVFMLLTLGWVVNRQSESFAAANEFRELRDHRASLESIRGELQGRIRIARSRPVVVPRAEGLGLRQPLDTEVVIIRLSGQGPDSGED